MVPTNSSGIVRLAMSSGKLGIRQIALTKAATRHFRSTSSSLSGNASTQGNTSPDALASPLPEIKPTTLSRDALLRLHKLSALNPPAEGSEEERQLVEGLGDLIGLMELVKDVKLEGDVGELLAEGVGEVVVDGAETGKSGQETTGATDKSGRELLDWATRRVGDFYAHRVERKT